MICRSSITTLALLLFLVTVSQASHREIEPPKWDLNRIRAQGDRFLVESFHLGDPLRTEIELAVTHGRLRLTLNDLSADEIQSLCDYRAILQNNAKNILLCPQKEHTLGALPKGLLSASHEIESVLNKIYQALPAESHERIPPPVALELNPFLGEGGLKQKASPPKLVTPKAEAPSSGQPRIKPFSAPKAEPPPKIEPFIAKSEAEPPPVSKAPPEEPAKQRVGALAPTGQIAGAYWNSWLQLRDSDALPKKELEVNNEYTFTLDLSPFLYEQEGALGGEPGAELKKALEKVSGNKLTIFVRPVLGGRGLEPLNEDEFALRKMEIDHLERLRTPLPEPKNDRESFYEFADRVRAGRLTIGLKTTQEGECAVVGLSIWNEAQDRALDHVVRAVAILDKDGKKPNCEPAGTGRKALGSGMLSLFDLNPDTKADGGLHVFKLNKSFSAAIYVERSGGQTQSYAWTFKDDLGRFIHNRELLKAFSDGRQKDEPYKEFSNQLSMALFSAGDGSNKEQADKAKRALERFVTRSPEPSIFVRLVDHEGVNLFFPLGLLRVASTLLGEKVKLLLPLLRESYSHPGSCISNWTFVLPDKLERLEDLPQPFQDFYFNHVNDMSTRGVVRIGRLDDFRCYLGDTFAAECRDNKFKNQFTKPEALLLLSHHDKGNVWFESSGKIFRSSNIKRHFPPGSIAILAACGIGNLEDDPDRMAFLRELNTNGVDAAIVSPFEVPMELGIAFVKHFDAIVLKAFEEMKASPDQPGPDIATLFSRTVEAVSNDQSLQFIKANPKYEFLLAGNSGLRLCLKKEGSQ